MRTQYDEELKKLNLELKKMSHLVENALEDTIKAFKTQDKDLAMTIINQDRLVNDIERSIESRSFGLILKQQPIASDLRDVTAALKVVTDLERIGDQAADIAEIIISFKEEHLYHSLEHIPAMAKQTIVMVNEAIDAFVHKDLSKAIEVKKMDDMIDELFTLVKQDIVSIVKEDHQQADLCIDFLMIAKYFERIGDHAVNICEWLEYNQKGTVNEQRLI